MFASYRDFKRALERMKWSLPYSLVMASGVDDIEAALEVVRGFVSAYAPDAGVALLAGSRARGNFNATSDYDVVVLCGRVADGARREMVRFEEADFEVFVHDLGTLAYFCREVERPSAKPVLAAMIVEGVPAIVNDVDLLDEARRMAGALIAEGPEPLSEMAIEGARYSISTMAESLRVPVEMGVRVALGSSLFIALSEFALRSRGCWIGGGKGIVAALAAADVGLEERFTLAFAALFEQGDAVLAQALVDEVLAPFGGRLRAGYKQQAPAGWRDGGV